MRPTDEEEYEEILNQYLKDQEEIQENNQEDDQEYDEIKINYEIKKELQHIKRREYLVNYRAVNSDKHECELCGGHYTTLNINAHVKTKKHLKCLEAL